MRIENLQYGDWIKGPSGDKYKFDHVEHGSAVCYDPGGEVHYFDQVAIDRFIPCHAPTPESSYDPQRQVPQNARSPVTRRGGLKIEQRDE